MEEIIQYMDNMWIIQDGIVAGATKQGRNRASIFSRQNNAMTDRYTPVRITILPPRLPLPCPRQGLRAALRGTAPPGAMLSRYVVRSYARPRKIP